MINLPEFKYHANPLKTGSIISSEQSCVCCDKERGYIYVGPVYATEELDKCLCPWCIADGSVHIKYDAEFVETDGIGGYGAWDSVKDRVESEIAYRTPGFSGWQQERWWTHCNDGAVFLGVMGKNEVLELGSELVSYLKSESGVPDSDWPDYFDGLSQDGSPTAYVFQCLHCKKLGGYTDCD